MGYRGAEFMIHWRMLTMEVLSDVLRERERQVSIHGHNEDIVNGTGPETRWLLPYTSESAKQIEAALRLAYEDFAEETGKPTWLHILLEEFSEAMLEDDEERLEIELIQVAAVAVNWVEKIRLRRSPSP